MKPSTTRGQTTLDFAIAMGIFLLAIAFTFSFIPSLTAPFADGEQDQSVTADRIASHVSEGALGDPNDPYLVNETCATPFFDDNQQDFEAIPDGCGYNGTGVNERVGLTDRHDVFIEIVHIDPEQTGDDRFNTVCLDEDDTISHEDSGSNCDVLYEIGEEPSDGVSTTVARRVLTIPECDFGTDSCDTRLRVTIS